MDYKEFEINFVERTEKIIEKLSDKTEYEVTLLINCLFGLIVIPTENNYKGYKRYEKYCIEQLRKYAHIYKETDDYKLVKCMKNALSHLHIEIATEDEIISEIKFCDRFPDANEYHTEIIFEISDLQKYALHIAKYYIGLLKGNRGN